jgi:hypothetical protein
MCPINSGHTINTSLTTIVQSIDTTVLALKEETIPTQGFYRAKGVSQQITNEAAGSVTTFQHLHPYRISLLEGWFFTETNQIGDYVSVDASPNTTIGYIIAPVSVNDTVIYVSSTVIPNVAVGFSLKLFNGTTMADLGEIISIDVTNQTVTVETGSASAFSPETPTYILLTVKIIENFYINAAPVKFEFARKKIGGKSIPPNIPLAISYHNVTGGAKNFCYCMEFMY